MPLPISALLFAGFWLVWPWLVSQLLPLAPSSACADLLVVLERQAAPVAARTT